MATTNYAGGSVDTIEEDLRWYLEEVGKVDAAIATIESLDTPGKGTANLCDPASWR